MASFLFLIMKEEKEEKQKMTDSKVREQCVCGISSGDRPVSVHDSRRLPVRISQRIAKPAFTPIHGRALPEARAWKCKFGNTTSLASPRCREGLEIAEARSHSFACRTRLLFLMAGESLQLAFFTSSERTHQGRSFPASLPLFLTVQDCNFKFAARIYSTCWG